MLDQRAHEPEQQRQQQRADVLAVDVGVGHQHDLVVAQLVEVEVLAGCRCRSAEISACTSLFGQHLVDAGLLDVEDLAADRQDRLGLRVAAAARPSRRPSRPRR